MNRPQVSSPLCGGVVTAVSLCFLAAVFDPSRPNLQSGSRVFIFSLWCSCSQQRSKLQPQRLQLFFFKRCKNKSFWQDVKQSDQSLSTGIHFFLHVNETEDWLTRMSEDKVQKLTLVRPPPRLKADIFQFLWLKEAYKQSDPQFEFSTINK